MIYNRKCNHPIISIVSCHTWCSTGTPNANTRSRRNSVSSRSQSQPAAQARGGVSATRAWQPRETYTMLTRGLIILSISAVSCCCAVLELLWFVGLFVFVLCFCFVLFFHVFFSFVFLVFFKCLSLIFVSFVFLFCTSLLLLLLTSFLFLLHRPSSFSLPPSHYHYSPSSQLLSPLPPLLLIFLLLFLPFLLLLLLSIFLLLFPLSSPFDYSSSSSPFSSHFSSYYSSSYY